MSHADPAKRDLNAVRTPPNGKWHRPTAYSATGRAAHIACGKSPHNMSVRVGAAHIPAADRCRVCWKDPAP